MSTQDDIQDRHGDYTPKVVSKPKKEEEKINEKIDMMIELKKIGCDDRTCLDVVHGLSSELIDEFKWLIRSGMVSDWAYKCILNIPGEKFSEILQLKEIGMSDENIYNILLLYDQEIVKDIIKLYKNGFKIDISIHAGIHLSKSVIDDMIRMKDAGFSDEICYESCCRFIGKLF